MGDDALIELLRARIAGVVAPAAALRDAIEQLIDSDQLENGRRLPTERSLADELGVPRLAIRQAFEGLALRGAITRRHGSGTYVSSAKIEGNLRILSGFSDEMNGTPHQTRTRILQFGFCAADLTVQRELEIDDDALSAVRLVRVRYIDDVPSTYEVSWMPARIAGHLVGVDLSNVSLFRVLAETKGVVPDHATEKLRASTLGATEAQVLECDPGTAVFLVNRTSYDAAGSPIEYAETVLRGDRFFYSTTLEAPHRLPAVTEPLSQFETLASDA
jgi:GntR family transcriptional regulator